MLGSSTYCGVAYSLAEVPATLIWAVLILILGIVAVLSAILLLPREQGDYSGAPPGVSRGEYLQHLTRALRAIRAVNSLIVTETDSEQLLHKACQTLTQTRGYKMAWIGMVERGSQRLYPVSQSGFEEGYLEEARSSWDGSTEGQGPTGRAVKYAEPAVVRDIETAPGSEPWREEALERGYRSLAALPLRFQGRVLGTLNVYAEVPDVFDIQEVEFLQELADHIGYALHSLRLEEELAEIERQLSHEKHVLSVFQHATVGLLSTDVDGVITSINGRMTELLGSEATPEGLVGEVMLQELEPFRSADNLTRVQEVFTEGREVEFRADCEAADGHTNSLVCRGIPAEDQHGNLTETIWTARESAEEGGEKSG